MAQSKDPRLVAVRISFCLDSGRPWPELADLALHAEAVGLHRLYLCDHFMPHRTDGQPGSGPVLEVWSTLAALAVTSHRVGLGTLVLGATYRHPTVVANMAATLDHISRGRLILGLGAGWQANEHRAYGIPLPPAGPRLAQFEEACYLIQAMLRGERPTFTGHYYVTVEAACEPLPVQARLPILIGGGGERRTLRVAAQFADEWHTWATPEEFRRKGAILDRHCVDVGRDPTGVRRLTGQAVQIIPIAASAATASGGGSDIVGSADRVAAHLAGYQEAKVDEFIIRDNASTPLIQARDQLSLLAADVLPRLEVPHLG